MIQRKRQEICYTFTKGSAREWFLCCSSPLTDFRALPVVVCTAGIPVWARCLSRYQSKYVYNRCTPGYPLNMTMSACILSLRHAQLEPLTLEDFFVFPHLSQFWTPPSLVLRRRVFILHSLLPHLVVWKHRSLAHPVREGSLPLHRAIWFLFESVWGLSR